MMDKAKKNSTLLEKLKFLITFQQKQYNRFDELLSHGSAQVSQWLPIKINKPHTRLQSAATVFKFNSQIILIKTEPQCSGNQLHSYTCIHAPGNNIKIMIVINQQEIFTTAHTWNRKTITTARKALMALKRLPLKAKIKGNQQRLNS